MSACICSCSPSGMSSLVAMRSVHVCRRSFPVLAGSAGVHATVSAGSVGLPASTVLNTERMISHMRAGLALQEIIQE